mgnify:CR=1 FL=1
MIIIHLENGRLGNQLIQYIGLKKYFPQKKLIFIGGDQLNQTFDSINTHFITKTYIKRWMPYILLEKLLYLFARLRIVGIITEDNTLKNFQITIRKGLLWKIFLTKNVFFQHKNIIENISYVPVLKPYLISKAKSWFKKKKIDIQKENLIFVHIRRGDYVNWPSNKFPAILTSNWYNRAMNLMSKRIDNPVFILMSDDQYYLRDVYKENKQLIISNNTAYVDLTIMSLCSSGILSASSFAFCGALLAKINNKENYFIAPKYWFGFQLKKWAPKNIKIDWITYSE